MAVICKVLTTGIMGTIVATAFPCVAQQDNDEHLSIIFAADCRNSKVTQMTVGNAAQTFASNVACDHVMLKLKPVQPGIPQKASVHLWMLSNPDRLHSNGGVFEGTFENDEKSPHMAVAVDKVYENLSSDWPPIIDAKGMCGFLAATKEGQGAYDLNCQIVAFWWGHQRHYDISTHLSHPKIQ
jgi:hypothetical protein